ncbi:uncharacterized protein M6B38_356355 [Iris pallida]|uniref:Uncharacterized protein n=1 Tax=Iris pallida TaxID=29817 RepID=A0AAX6GN81_IRIPA|nr:uncharacterized protein M6B38_362505 [Iris pallida]KAJ6829738.1 uncharacterized protein M6B38_356355 [Iris pallida]
MAMGSPLLSMGDNPTFWSNTFIKRSDLISSPRTCKTYIILCLASKGRGFGDEPLKKEKSNTTKVPQESMRVASKPSNFVSGVPKQRTKKAPLLEVDVDSKSRSDVMDRQFLEKIEAVRRSVREQKKYEKKVYQAIDYDAPVESEQTSTGLGMKVGVGIAVVVFGLVFALGDFLPSGSVGPNDDTSIIERKLTEKEKATLEGTLRQYEATLSNSPEDPTALEGAAVTLVELGEYKRAASLLEKLTKENPNDIEAYRLLGEVKYELKDFEGSASAFRSSLSASDSIDFEVLRGLTNSLLAAKRPSEAVQLLLSSRELLNGGKPDGSSVSMDTKGKLDQKVQEIDPIQVELLLGKAYSDWGHVSDAVAVYDQLISKYPNDFRGYLAKGIILKENGKIGDAERMFIQRTVRPSGFSVVDVKIKTNRNGERDHQRVISMSIFCIFLEFSCN